MLFSTVVVSGRSLLAGLVMLSILGAAEAAAAGEGRWLPFARAKAPVRPPASRSGPIVVTAFEPFGGRRLNRSLDTLHALRPRPGLVRAELPVVFARLPGEIDRLLELRPRALLMLGESPFQGLHVESRARNVADAFEPDNAGDRPRERTLVKGAPLTLSTTWDHQNVMMSIRRVGLMAKVSGDAGTFCCNASLFLALARSPSPAPPIGFLHLPAQAWPHGPRSDHLAEAVDAALSHMIEER